MTPSIIDSEDRMDERFMDVDGVIHEISRYIDYIRLTTQNQSIYVKIIMK